MPTKNNQAPAGGELGMNGEFYQGGQFMPSSAQTVKGSIKIPQGSGKKEIAPYIYELAPADDMLSIYDRINHACSDNRRACQYVKGSGFQGFRLEVIDQEVDHDIALPASHGGLTGQRYLGNGEYETVYRPIKDRARFDWLSNLAERFNSGERWYPLSEDPYHYLNQKEGSK